MTDRQRAQRKAKTKEESEMSGHEHGDDDEEGGHGHVSFEDTQKNKALFITTEVPMYIRDHQSRKDFDAMVEAQAEADFEFEDEGASTAPGSAG